MDPRRVAELLGEDVLAACERRGYDLRSFDGSRWSEPSHLDWYEATKGQDAIRFLEIYLPLIVRFLHGVASNDRKAGGEYGEIWNALDKDERDVVAGLLRRRRVVGGEAFASASRRPKASGAFRGQRLSGRYLPGMIVPLALAAEWTRQDLAWPGLTAELPGKPKMRTDAPPKKEMAFSKVRGVTARFGNVGFEAYGGEVNRRGVTDLGRIAQSVILSAVSQRSMKIAATGSNVNPKAKYGKQNYTAFLSAWAGKQNWRFYATAIRKDDRLWVVLFYWPFADPGANKDSRRIFDSIR